MRQIFLILAMGIGSLYAQLIDQQVEEETILIDGISTTVQKARVVGEVDEFRDVWRDFLKDEFDLKSSKKGDVIVAEEAVINRITDRRGDLILFLYPQEKEVSFNVAFRLGYDVYLNSKEFPEEATNLKDFTVYFINYYYYQYLEGYIKNQERNLADLQLEFKSANKAISKSSKSVAKMEKSIAKNEKRTEKLSSSLESVPEEERASVQADLSELRIENTELRQSIAEEKAPVAKYQTLVKSLEPKITNLELQLDRNRLMYIEARERIKR